MTQIKPIIDKRQKLSLKIYHCSDYVIKHQPIKLLYDKGLADDDAFYMISFHQKYVPKMKMKYQFDEDLRSLQVFEEVRDGTESLEEDLLQVDA